MNGNLEMKLDILCFSGKFRPEKDGAIGERSWGNRGQGNRGRGEQGWMNGGRVEEQVKSKKDGGGRRVVRWKEGRGREGGVQVERSK